MEIIKITWQKFVNGDVELPDRCNKTYLNLERAILKLEPLLLNFGVKLCFERQRLPMQASKNNEKLDYKTLIDNEPIENVVDIKKQKPVCFGFCAHCCKIECEEVDEEEIPEHLIITAVLTKVKEKTLKPLY